MMLLNSRQLAATTTTALMIAFGVLYQARKAAVSAFGVAHRQQQLHNSGRCLFFHSSSTALRVTDSTSMDDQGRRVRKRAGDNNEDGGDGGGGGGWDSFDPTSAAPERRSNERSSRSNNDNDNDNWVSVGTGNSGGGGGWDDFDPTGPPSRSSNDRGPSSSNRSSNNRGGSYNRGGGSNSNSNNRSSGGRGRNDYDSGPRRNDYDNSGGNRGGRNSFDKPFRKGNNRNQQPEEEDDTRKINMKALEGAGFCHLYGLSSVLNALEANRRDFTRPEDLIDLDTLTGADLEHELAQRDRKPQAQFTPYLFTQEQRAGSRGRSSEKAAQAERLLQVAEERGIPVATVDKGVLNTLSGNRPHQGYVLRCGAHLDFDSVSQLPHPDQDPTAPTFWLALDEVVDPQNLGALLRSAYFMGNGGKMGMLVCAKNSAPPSPTVSAASAGALELMNVSSTTNLPRTLATAESEGFRIVGASASGARDLDTVVYDLQDLPPSEKPTIVVLGSEGHGLRTLVAKSCTEFVKIPGADSADGVDSLNVSVTGGILLWHFLSGSK